jgi:HD-GYP domain-containing protein (c-di-GMP phosphodiesterase class II)
MLRVKPGELREGMIAAEPVLDVAGKVLLEAKAQFTKSNIELLKTWGIDFVRVREPGDTDETIEQELRKEQEKANSSQSSLPEMDLGFDVSEKIGINEANIVSILKGEIRGQAGTPEAANLSAAGGGTLASQEGVRYYHKFLNIISRLMENSTREKDFSVKEMSEVARIITDYVVATPGVIGYTLRPTQSEYKELARHTLSTTIVAGKIAMLLNYSNKEINNIIFACLLHDIGCIGLPQNIMNRSGRISQAEVKLYQTHVSLGLARIKGRSWIPKEVLLAVAQHHERIDGKGFPMGFTGNKIHAYAKIIAIADYFDDATHGRGIKPQTIPEISKQLSFLHDRFDAVVCGIFQIYLRDFLLSNNVELDDGRKGQIVYMHQAFTEPVIRTNDGEFIDLNRCRDIKIEQYSM